MLVHKLCLQSFSTWRDINKKEWKSTWDLAKVIEPRMKNKHSYDNETIGSSPEQNQLIILFNDIVERKTIFRYDNDTYVIVYLIFIPLYTYRIFCNFNEQGIFHRKRERSAHTLHNSRILMHAFAARFFTRQRVVGIHGCRLCWSV